MHMAVQIEVEARPTWAHGEWPRGKARYLIRKMIVLGGVGMNKCGIGLFALTLAAPLIGPNPSVAEGALAVGTTGHVANDGIAMGTGFNYATRQGAIDRALAECRGRTDAPKATPFCQIVGTFTRQCAATSLDPKAGTPGAGWAVAPSQQKANSQALANCRATAGANRRQFCKIGTSDCDTHD
jgi:hypothetical protein